MTKLVLGSISFCPLLKSLPFPKVLEWYFHQKKSYMGEKKYMALKKSRAEILPWRRTNRTSFGLK